MYRRMLNTAGGSWLPPVVGLCLIGCAATGHAQIPREILAGTIVARETNAWFYSNGVMTASEATFELTFEVRETSVIRRAARNLLTGEVLVDNTEYRFVTDLTSYPAARASLAFQPLTDDMRKFSAAIKAIGRPGSDAIEILYIGPDWLQTVKTVSNYMVISRYSRSQ